MTDRTPPLEAVGAWMLAALWLAPILFALWAAIHPPEYLTSFDPLAPLTTGNFERAFAAAPFGRYMLNTALLVTGVIAAQFVLCTLAAYAFARWTFPGSGLLFALVLVQLMVAPEILMVQNYATVSRLGLLDSLAGVAIPYLGSALGVFLLRQTFRQVPKELEEAAVIEGAGPLTVLWRVYVPLARPVYVAYGLVMASFHWNNFLWPLVVTSSVTTRPVTVGLQVFASVDQGIDWAVISAAALATSAPLLIGFLLFQRAFVQSFMRAGIR
ncbi:carbohydrate ABC transporter permease [Rubrimonas sp.]|uniref:carbohydrate ABC transporter permease n=1 Tax=Rubrimonas sp. TaxID=2036015 RepID=UPI002FDCFA75